MFRRIFGSNNEQAADQAETALNAAATTAGDTATVRRIVAKLEAHARRAGTLHRVRGLHARAGPRTPTSDQPRGDRRDRNGPPGEGRAR